MESINWLFQFIIAISLFYFFAFIKNIFKFIDYPNILEWLKVGLFVFELLIISWYLFKALNDETRRQILELLKENDRTAGEIADAFNISKPSISHHLDILKRADLVTSEKQGQFIIYSINTTILEDVLQWIITLKK